MLCLVDGNNFFVSCERVFNPKLEGKPVAVLSNNDGCCISRSNEFKALGIKMGTPYFQLKKDEKRLGLIMLSSNYALYGDMSRRLIAVLEEFSPNVEQYSIDEAFLEVPNSESDFLAFGKKLRQTLLRYLGIPCGVGIAPTKTLCKIANHLAKKSKEGVLVLPADCQEILKATPIEEVWGIGRALAPKVQALGILSAYDLAKHNLSLIRKHFGLFTQRTALELRGTPCIEDEPEETKPKSISHSRTFGVKVTSLDELKESVASYLSSCAVKLRQSGQVAAGALVYFRSQFSWEDYKFGTKSIEVIFPRPTDSTSSMLNAIVPRLKEIYDKNLRYRKSGVVLFGLEDKAAPSQRDLFQNDGAKKEVSKLFATVDAINKKFGKGTLGVLAEGTQKRWSMKRDHLSRCYTTDWKELLEVK